MRLKINYTTTYSYDAPVPYALQQLRMTPRNARGQEVRSWDLSVAGGAKQVSFEDQFKNITNLISMESDASVIEIRCEGEVETSDHNGIVGKHKGFAPLWLFRGATGFTTPGQNIRKLASKVRHEDFDNRLESLHFLSNSIGSMVKYETGRTDSTTNAEEALSAGHGVCQDHSHIMITTARLLGFPARYVSGYLMMNDRIDQDASHAWCEVWVEELGWVGFDVSNGISPDERYVRVAVGRDYKDASPVRGIRMGHSQEELCVSLQVQQ